MGKEKGKAKLLVLANRISGLAVRAGLDRFILGLIGVVLLAYFWPEGGTGEGPFSLSQLTNYGVSLIFFFYGLRLKPKKLRADLGNWRLHLVVQLSTFVLFPLLVLAGKPLFGNEQNELIWLGIFFLAAVPSTVSSSVVMVSVAEGNIAAAIFNASISSLLGVFITPILMGLVLSSSGGAGVEMGPVILKLMLQVLAPVLLGISLHSKFGGFAERHRQKLKSFDQTVILLIVYTSFSKSFATNMFSGLSVGDLLLLGAGLLGFFFLVFILISLVSRLMGFSREDRIAVVFCGSKKSLVHGTVMSKVIFSNAGVVGMVLLPLMLYHALQLIAASMIAQRMARKKEVTAAG